MRNALIVWGGWAGHEPEAVAALTAEMLRGEGFAVKVTDDIAALGGAGIGSYSLVVPMITNAEIAKPVAQALSEAVRAGTGLGGPHGALATSFRRSVDFHYLTGVQWVAHPGNIIDFHVTVARPDDPIMQGIADFNYNSEQYYLHHDPSIEVLATTRFSGEYDEVTAGVVMPVVFKRRFGKGRVFYSALGHVAAEFERQQTRTILLRGLLWAARAD